MSEHKQCLICNSPKLKDLADYKQFYLVQCRDCSFIFSKRIPTVQELEEHYQGYGRNDYLSPITIKRYHEILDRFEPYRKTNKLIDVGCGIGYFLEVAKERGWEVYGTEYTQDAVDICREKGIIMHKGALDTTNYDLGSFDVVTSFEVIEHINNPQEELANFNALLRPSGIVYVTTPNFNALQRYYLKDKYNVICYPEHLSYYTPKTIAHLFKQQGFRKQEIQTTGISLTRFKTSMKTSDEAFISETSTDEQLRNKIEGNKLLQVIKSTVNTTLTWIGKGDALKATFVKK